MVMSLEDVKKAAAMAAMMTRNAPGFTAGFTEIKSLLQQSQDHTSSALKQSQQHSYAMHATSTAANVQIATAAFSTFTHAFPGNGQHQTATTPTSTKPPNEWSCEETVAHLFKRSYITYAAYFRDENLNGMALIVIEEGDLGEMPEKNKLKQRAFLQEVTSLKKMCPTID
jgi:hypothetical protein